MIARLAAGFALAALFALPGAKPAAATCGAYDPWPCIPEIQSPLGRDLQRFAQRPNAQCPPKDPPPKELNTIDDVFTTFCACWRPPRESEARPGMEVTVRFSFNRNGEILGEPRFTFVTADVSADTRAVYKRAVADTLTRCTPLTFTPALGNALAGRPFSLRFVDDRGIKKVEHHGR